MTHVLTCPRCTQGQFTAAIVPGACLSDCHSYLELRCMACHRPGPTLQFVVDLTPEFDHNTEATCKAI